MDHYNSKTKKVHYLAIVTLAAVFGLLCIGGLVTSHEAGMAVPDWPNTFGYNIFVFPFNRWVGNVFYEHTHRLWAAGVGLLTLCLCVALIWSQKRTWLRWLGVLALVAVSLQGVLGGLRVTLMKDEIGIFHACLAHSFFVLIGLIALFTSRWWLEKSQLLATRSVHRHWPWLVLSVCCLIFIQLILGATMRHAHRGLAIHDFPLAYGQIWPATDPNSMEVINEGRFRYGEPETTAGQIQIQMAHRIGAVLVTLGVIVCAAMAMAYTETPEIIRFGSAAWAVLLILQLGVGAATIWSNKAADIATAHVAIGALSLLGGVFLAAIAWRIRVPKHSTHVTEHHHQTGTTPTRSRV